MTQSLHKIEKSAVTEATPEQTTENGQSEATGLAKLVRAAGAEPPPVQRSVEQLRNLPSEQLRQRVLRSLGRQYGNQYTGQVMRQYRAFLDAPKPIVARAVEELPSEAEIQAEIQAEMSAVEPVQAEGEGGEVSVPALPTVDAPPAPPPLVKESTPKVKPLAVIKPAAPVLHPKAAPPKLPAQALHGGKPKIGSASVSNASVKHIEARSSLSTATGSTTTGGKAPKRLKNGLIHKGLNKLKGAGGQAKAGFGKIGPKSRLAKGVARLVGRTRQNVMGILRPAIAPGVQIQRAPAAATPDQHPGFKLIKGQIKQAAKNQKQHQPAKAKANQAQAAAQPPSNEKTTMAQTGQVDEMSQQQPKGFNKAAFVSALHQAIEAVTPQNQEEADDFKKSGKAGQVKGQVSQIVSQDKQDSEKDIKATTEASPDPSKAKGEPKQVVPMEAEAAGAAPVIPGAGAAMPTPKTESEVSLQAGKTQVNDQMSQANVTEEQLRKSNEPAFNDALKSKQAVETHADTAPAQFRAAEGSTLQGAQSEAQEKASKALSGMNAGRTNVLSGVTTHQQTAKSSDEKARAEVSQKIEGIYNTTKTEATKILTDLDGKVNDLFDKGEKAARDAFENYVDRRMTAYKKERYDGITGGIQWGIDKLLGMPSEVNAFYVEGRNLYLQQMDGVIDRVADLVVGELNRAKARIEAGRQEITKYVDGLSPELKKVGQDAQQEIQGKFDQLDQDVDSKQDALVNDLAQKYVAARSAVDERINAMKDENKGLVSKATEAIGGVIQTIMNLKNMLLGVLAKAAGVIDKIISDPIGFLGNLISAVGSGLHKFVGNIGKHLKNGLMGWLFGALGDAGIQMPESLDLKGILHLVMQVLGLTYQNVRARAVAIVGGKTIGMIESGVEIFKKMITEGPIALWHLIQDKLADLKDTVLGGIMDFIKDKIVQAGISWIIGLLSPAGAFIKACQAIYGIITFFIERGSQIMELVNAILDSVGAIAAGSIGQAADFVENALGKAVPVTLGFLANLLGLGGISDKIRKIIQKVQGPVNKAIDAVVKGIAKPFKKLLNSKFVTNLKNKAKQGVDWAKNKVKQGVDWTKNKVKQGTDWVKGKTNSLFGKDKDKDQPKQKGNDNSKQDQLKLGMTTAKTAVEKFKGKEVSAAELTPILAPVKKQYKLQVLEPVKQGEHWAIHGEVSRITLATDALTTAPSDKSKVEQAREHAQQAQKAAQQAQKAAELEKKRAEAEQAGVEADKGLAEREAAEKALQAAAKTTTVQMERKARRGLSVVQKAVKNIQTIQAEAEAEVKKAESALTYSQNTLKMLKADAKGISDPTEKAEIKKLLDEVKAEVDKAAQTLKKATSDLSWIKKTLVRAQEAEKEASGALAGVKNLAEEKRKRIEQQKLDFQKAFETGVIDGAKRRYGELDQHGRGTGIIATVDKPDIKTGTEAKGEILPSGWPKNNADASQAVALLAQYRKGTVSLTPAQVAQLRMIANSARGRAHLLGNQLGGSGDDPRNLVTMLQSGPNAGYMSTAEALVREMAEDDGPVIYKVTPLYKGSNAEPYAVKLEAKSSKRNLQRIVRNKLYVDRLASQTW